MSIDRAFVAFCAAIGLIGAAILIFRPDAQNFWIPPYFWVLIAMALFEAALVMVKGGVPGLRISNFSRVLGLLFGIALMAGIPILVGSPARLF
jgi:hypothetical protein